MGSLENKMDIAKGKFERTSAENYDELLKALDVNFLLRKAATASTPVMEVTEEGGVWTIKTSTVLKSMELKFKVGEKFDETTPDGRNVDSVVTVDGNKFICVQTAKMMEKSQPNQLGSSPRQDVPTPLKSP